MIIKYVILSLELGEYVKPLHETGLFGTIHQATQFHTHKAAEDRIKTLGLNLSTIVPVYTF